MSGGFTIRQMSPGDMSFAVEAAAQEGWNPGLHDGECFYRSDPGGFLMGLLGADPIGCISAVSYEGLFGFIGFYIVAPEFRHKGYGIRLWKAAMDRLAGHNVGLDGVPDQQENYKKSGFRLAYSNIRFECEAPRAPVTNPRTVVELAQVPFALVERYDRPCFPAKRSTFLRAWTGIEQSLAAGCVEDGTLKGYGVIRRCRQGYKVGPLFADDAAVAETLYLHLCNFAEDREKVYLDVPEVNHHAMGLANRYGMHEVFRTARMYTGTEPEIDLDRIFGVTTFELG